MELHGQQHSPDCGPAEGSHPPAHPEQPRVPGPHRHLRAAPPPAGGLGLRLHHVLLHGRPARSPGWGGGRRDLGCRSPPGPQFYHACDQPGDAVLCILNYDALQYCDFLGSGVSVWVTVLCMARLKASLKYVSDLLMPAVWVLGEQRPLCTACQERHQKGSSRCPRKPLVLTSRLLAEVPPAVKGLCWLLRGCQERRWWAGLGQAPIQRGGLEPQTWTRPPREAPGSVPGVSVLRTLWGMAAGDAGPGQVCASETPLWGAFWWPSVSNSVLSLPWAQVDPWLRN